jgi:hypothetical protein
MFIDSNNNAISNDAGFWTYAKYAFRSQYSEAFGNLL